MVPFLTVEDSLKSRQAGKGNAVVVAVDESKSPHKPTPEK